MMTGLLPLLVVSAGTIFAVGLCISVFKWFDERDVQFFLVGMLLTFGSALFYSAITSLFWFLTKGILL